MCSFSSRLAWLLLAVCSSLLFLDGAHAADNMLARTPPMGWNSWNKFGCNVSEQLIRDAADAMVSSGMQTAGYEYVVIDDCWQVGRDSNGNILADPQRFPSGIKALADYVHGNHLKFGLYSDAGTNTCAGRPGSRGYEYQDARQYAAWGVDYLKFDWCNTGSENAEAAYTTMHNALKATGRPIVLSICEWGKSKPWLWAKDVGNLWRTTGDIYDCWDCKKESTGWVVILDQQDGLETFAGPGHWNDPDMLEVGNGGMSVTEYQSHFSLWSMLAAPLIAGNDLKNMTPEIKDILTNKEVLAVDQDDLGMQGRRVSKNGDLEVWVKQLHNGSRAVVLFNRGGSGAEISASWEDLGYPSRLPAVVRDLWNKKDLGVFTGKFNALVASHGVVMLRIMPVVPSSSNK
ncbi:MAG TPA: glycoside hydrolase family 27 protein [Candidatus Acidoferrum sp.]|nr:glycoside hydrolase family 27 protein [Candidatus Acidoferrum sp.]